MGVIFIITLSLFRFIRNSQHSEKSSIPCKNFFRKCEYIRSCYLPISSDLLKESFWKTSIFVVTVTGVLEKVFCQVIVVIIIIKILEKFLWKKSVLELIFRNSLLVHLSRILTTILEHLFWRTVPLATSSPCSILVDNT